METYLKYFYKILIGIIIYFFCGISYNMLEDIINNRVMIMNSTYYVTIFHDSSIIDHSETRIKPEIGDNYISYIDKENNRVTYGNTLFKIYELKDGNNVH